MQSIGLADASMSVANYRDVIALYTLATNVGAAALQNGNSWDRLPAQWQNVHGKMTELYQRLATEIGREDLRTRDLYLLTPEGAANAAIDLVGTLRDFNEIVSSRTGQPVAMLEYLQSGRGVTAPASSGRSKLAIAAGVTALVAIASGVTYALTRRGRGRRR